METDHITNVEKAINDLRRLIKRYQEGLPLDEDGGEEYESSTLSVSSLKNVTSSPKATRKSPVKASPKSAKSPKKISQQFESFIDEKNKINQVTSIKKKEAFQQWKDQLLSALTQRNSNANYISPPASNSSDSYNSGNPSSQVVSNGHASAQAVDGNQTSDSSVQESRLPKFPSTLLQNIDAPTPEEFKRTLNRIAMAGSPRQKPVISSESQDSCSSSPASIHQLVISSSSNNSEVSDDQNDYEPKKASNFGRHTSSTLEDVSISMSGSDSASGNEKKNESFASERMNKLLRNSLSPPVNVIKTSPKSPKRDWSEIEDYGSTSSEEEEKKQKLSESGTVTESESQAELDESPIRPQEEKPSGPTTSPITPVTKQNAQGETPVTKKSRSYSLSSSSTNSEEDISLEQYNDIVRRAERVSVSSEESKHEAAAENEEKDSVLDSEESNSEKLFEKAKALLEEEEEEEEENQVIIDNKENKDTPVEDDDEEENQVIVNNKENKDTAVEEEEDEENQVIVNNKENKDTPVEEEEEEEIKINENIENKNLITEEEEKEEEEAKVNVDKENKNISIEEEEEEEEAKVNEDVENKNVFAKEEEEEENSGVLQFEKATSEEEEDNLDTESSDDDITNMGISELLKKFNVDVGEEEEEEI